MANKAMMSRNPAILVLATLLAASPATLAFDPEPVPPPPPPDPRIALLSPSSGSYLGIGVVEVTQERARALQLREEHGVEITRMEDDSPAAKAGLKPGDVVLEYNGQRIEGVEQFMRLVRETPPGRDVRLLVSRGGANQTIVARTGSRKTWLASKYGDAAVEIPRIHLPDVRMPDVPRALMTWRSTVLGIEAESLDSQLAQYFGVKEGVLVRSVVKSSAAEKAGLRAGDVITRAGDRAVATPGEISAAARAARAKKNLVITIMRDKQESAVTLPVDDGASDSHYALPRSVREK
ncbi:MAG TPA: PDZ domain-containing protein [Bryobacteraceae bacterium]|nr:PDZ domain-containing protein [Bryobacteraceae bacterium]